MKDTSRFSLTAALNLFLYCSRLQESLFVGIIFHSRCNSHFLQGFETGSNFTFFHNMQIWKHSYKNSECLYSSVLTTPVAAVCTHLYFIDILHPKCEMIQCKNLSSDFIRAQELHPAMKPDGILFYLDEAQITQITQITLKALA